VYWDRSGNEWKDRDNFKKMPGKFYPVDVEYEEDDDTTIKMDRDSSKLDPRVQELILLIFDIQKINHSLSEMSIDTTKMSLPLCDSHLLILNLFVRPLGKISNKSIKQGFSVS